MADDVQISTPEINTDVNTSETELAKEQEIANTSETELTGTNTAEIQTNQEQNTQNNQEKKLFADKYQSIEEFEKGYKELNKELTQFKQIQSKYNEYLKRQEAQNAIQLERAREQGFNTLQDKEISDKVTIEEFNAYANSLNILFPEHIETVRENLLNYYQTGNRTYLEEAKRYFPSDFIERVAIGKQNLINTLQGQYKEQTQNAFNEQEQKLADTIKTDYGEFLSDIKENNGKSEALKMFCNAGFIKTKEDFQVFTEIYNSIAGVERAKAIKEYEAKKTIEKEKQKAVINSSTAPFDANKKPTANDVARMSQKQFDEYCNKYGTDWIYTH